MKAKALFLVGALAVSIVLARPASLGAFDMCDEQQTLDQLACEGSVNSCIEACQNSYQPGATLDACESGCSSMNALCTSGASFDHDWCESSSPEMDFCLNARGMASSCLIQFQVCAGDAGGATDVISACGNMYMICLDESHVGQCQ